MNTITEKLADALTRVLGVADTAATLLRKTSPAEARRFREDSTIVRALLAEYEALRQHENATKDWP